MLYEVKKGNYTMDILTTRIITVQIIPENEKNIYIG